MQPIAVNLDDGGFDADAAWTGIEDQIKLVAKIDRDSMGACRADAAGRVGAWCRHRTIQLPDDIAHPAKRHTDSKRLQSRRHKRMDGAIRIRFVFQRQNDSQRAGPEYFGELARQGIESDIALGHGDAAYMGDQGIELRASLGREDSSHALAV